MRIDDTTPLLAIVAGGALATSLTLGAMQLRPPPAVPAPPAPITVAPGVTLGPAPYGPYDHAIIRTPLTPAPAPEVGRDATPDAVREPSTFDAPTLALPGASLPPRSPAPGDPRRHLPRH